jgi:LuxR family maltose regulon positive regulatory protein
MMGLIGLGHIQETQNQLHLAAESYREALQLVGDPPPPPLCDAHLGLARLHYQWNDLEAAHQHGQKSVQLARQIETTDRFVASELFLARLKLAQDDLSGTAFLLAAADEAARRHNFVQQMPEVAAVQLLLLLRQGNLAAAAQLAQTHEFPLSQARVYLAQGDPPSALAVLEPFGRQMEDRGWQDERLKTMILQTLTHQAHGQKDQALQLLGDALALAEPGGFIRIFIDEGPPIAQLLSEAAARGIMPNYTNKLLAAFESETQKIADKSYQSPAPANQSLIEPLSPRELEVLHLIAQGLSNREISRQLFLALSTIKGHNRIIFDKLQVQRRTEAVARARELGLL